MDTPGSAGSYRTPTVFGIEVTARRAWVCAHGCGVSWYDTFECPRCRRDGEPEVLNGRQAVVTEPDKRE